jgi:RimJ/RimL family protein N-acetyltransferase
VLITEAVEEHYRGQGAATCMIRFAQNTYGDITAEILATNLASIRLHEATGFRHAGEKGNVRILRYRA